MTNKVSAVASAIGGAFESLPEESTRRLLLTAGGAAALALFAQKAEAQTRPPGFEAASNWKSPTNRLVRRITNGIDTTEMSIAGSLGFKPYLEKQLNYSTINDNDVDRVVASRWPKMSWTEAQLYDDNDQYHQYLDLVYSTIYRSIYSRKMLYERMVEFWTDHFNVSAQKVSTPLLTTYIQKTIRRHAMGKFPDLLKSTAHAAAMLNFLDNDANTADAPNINYSRELHELHTVGVDGGYTGKDLRQAALVLSGWTWSWNSNSYNRGRFKFEIDWHAGGTKTVMGQQYLEDGQNEGERLLTYLSLHPNTARFITKKLILKFLGEPVNNTVWTAAQNAFLNSGGDIVAVLRVILTQTNLMASNAKFKRPGHLLVSALRACRSRCYQFDSLVWGSLNPAGHVPFDWEPPDGYPDRFEFWAPSPLPRINTAFLLARNYFDNVVTDVEKLFGTDRTPTGCTANINKILFGGEMSTADRDALFNYLNVGVVTDDRLKGAVALALASPSFQWH
ncbi:MAG: DUF1800 domain-containing protein [Armatimonadetes bacterium]|nr:DUF1800 domain-containing protein [Armatimonadota bacterium]